MSGSSEVLRQVIDINPHFIFVKDREGRFTLVNDAVAAAYGTTVEQLIGRTDADFNDNADEVAAFRRDDLEVMDTLREKYIAEEVVTDAQGCVHYLQTIKRPLLDPDGVARHVLGVATDVTALKRAAEERRKLEAKIQHAQKMESLGLLAGGVAHDFNNLLVGILANVDVLRGLVPQVGHGLRSLEAIRVAAKRAADLCHQMVAYSGRGHFLVERVDMNEVILELEDLLQASITKKASLEHQLAPSLPGIDADPIQVRQVVMNLIVNAGEAFEGQEGRIRVATGTKQCGEGEILDIWTREALPAGEYVVLDVTDTGAGMTPEVARRIFDPFYSTKGHGRGLGLAAVQGIVRGHRGAILVESEPGRGTAFHVLLPVGRIPAAAPPEAPVPAPEIPEGKRVLVVDDEPIVRDAIRSVLELEGVVVLTAADGESALEIVKQEGDRLDGVLLDLTMPRKGGEEVLRELRREREDLPVVLMSGFDLRPDRQPLAGFTPRWFLKKPFEADALRAVVQQLSRTVTQGDTLR